MKQGQIGMQTMAKKTFTVVPFMLKYHLTYDQATFWIELLQEQQKQITFENLEYAMLSLENTNTSEHNIFTQGVTEQM